MTLHHDAHRPVADLALGRAIGTVNWRGLWTLFAKEVHRFLKIPTQTILAPTVTTLMFLAIFALALGGAVSDVAGVPFLTFISQVLVIIAVF